VCLGELFVAGKDAGAHSGAASTPASLDDTERWINRLESLVKHGPEGHFEDVGAAPALRDRITVLHKDGLTAIAAISTNVAHHVSNFRLLSLETLCQLENILSSRNA